MKRKVYLFISSLLVFSLLAGTFVSFSCAGKEEAQPTAAAEEKIHWQWNSYHEAANPLIDGDHFFAEQLEKLTNGNFTVKVYPAGQLTVSTETYNSIRTGAFKIGSGSSIVGHKDWTLVTSHGLYFTAADFINWYYSYGGAELLDEMHKEYGCKWLPLYVMACDMGWLSDFPITTIADFKGKKVRAGAVSIQECVKDWGGAVMFIAGSEIYEAKQRGIVDLFEFVSPKVDWSLGFHEITKYWVAPAWYQSFTAYGMSVNRKAWDALPPQYQAAIEAASNMTVLAMQGKDLLEGAEYTLKWIDYGVKLSRVSDAFYKDAMPAYNAAVLKLAEKSKWAATLYRSQLEYLKDVNDWKAMQTPYTYGPIFKAAEYPVIPDAWCNMELLNKYMKTYRKK